MQHFSDLCINIQDRLKLVLRLLQSYIFLLPTSVFTRPYKKANCCQPAGLSFP